MKNVKRNDKGEFILLGVFGIFMIAYLIDVHDLPWEATILSYILSPFILGLILYYFLSAFFQQQKSNSDRPQRNGKGEPLKTEATLSEEMHGVDDEGDKKIDKIRLYKAVSMGCLLFASIFFFGFYVGSGFMLLIWFLLFRKINRTAIIITVASPLLLYLVFEVVINFGLYEGKIFQYLKQ